ncbi:MAG: response regulator [Bacteroidales bacterium]|nr:response regulator [Bacteroidales bacterium]
MEEKIKVLIVEDEFTIALDLENRLTAMNFDVVGNASSYNEALMLLAEKQIDIAILDINLNEKKSGIDIAKIIKEKFNIPVIFLTAYTDDSFFKETLPTNPMGYITKPFKDNDLSHNITLAIERFKNNEPNTLLNESDNKNFIFVKDNNKLIKIDISDILWIQAVDNYSLIKTLKGKFFSSSNLRTTLEKINDENIVRIHKSHAVAIDKIDKIEDNMVYIKSDFFGISRKFKEDLMKKFKLL